MMSGARADTRVLQITDTDRAVHVNLSGESGIIKAECCLYHTVLALLRWCTKNPPRPTATHAVIWAASAAELDDWLEWRAEDPEAHGKWAVLWRSDQ